MTHGVDEKLLEFCVTDRQREILLAVNKHGGKRPAARALGINPKNIYQVTRAVMARASQHGYSPDHDMLHTVPEPFKVKGISTLYNESGEVRQQWVKSTLDQEKVHEAQQAALAALAEDLPRVKPIAPPRVYMKDLCNLYTLTDYHVGMLAWHKEGGADWDLKIAEKTAIEVFGQIVAGSPKAETCVVNQLGDFLHSDGLTPVTPTSGHILDQDGRFSKVVAVAIRILRAVIDMALSAHKHVHVVIAEGNHDMASSVWLRHMFKALYENEPRISVNDSELPFYAYQHGKTMLAFHHGHMKKKDNLQGVFAAMFPKMWGDTTKRYAHAGHFHHIDEKEHNGMLVTQHPTLAARDAFASRGAYFAERAMMGITYHKEFGQIARNIVSPEMALAA